jgi:hypothetical protein
MSQENMIWIEHKEGGGFMTHKAKLDKWIKKFFNKNI